VIVDEDLPPPHDFLHQVRVVAVPGPSTPLIDEVMAGLRAAFSAHGHHWSEAADDRTSAFLTTARLHEPIAWRRSPLFVGRKQWGLQHTPANYALVQVKPAELRELTARFTAALASSDDHPPGFDLPGLAPQGWQVLRDQGARGGPMMCVARLLQAQAKSLRVVMVVGETQAESAYLFDLAGAYPRIVGRTPERLCAELALRIVTQLSTRAVTFHRVVGARITRELWQRAAAPAAMLRVSRELGRRDFFTRMVRIADLVEVPALTDAIAQQYSEGCFGTWDPDLGAQVVTVTGSGKPVAKSELSEDDLAVIGELLDGGAGVAVRPVAQLRNDPPSSEAVEFAAIDTQLPRCPLPREFGGQPGPVVRSKLHGHRGVTAYDPATVEFVPLAAPFHDYLVSCSTDAQARGIAEAFGRAQALRDPADPRTVVFTILPGHGLLMVEKWVAGAEPFSVLLRAMDEGRLEVCSRVPQGRFAYARAGGRMVLAEEAAAAPATSGAAGAGIPSASQRR